MVDRGPMKLTAKGNLMRATCREMVDSGMVDREWVQGRLQGSPIRSEQDIPSHTVVKGMAELAGYTQRWRRRILLTRKGGEALGAGGGPGLYLGLFRTFAACFGCAYLDRYPPARIVQIGFGLSLRLLQTYGGEPRGVDFYAGRFLRSFPKALRGLPGSPSDRPEELFMRCYALRTFGRFFHMFGLAELEWGIWTSFPPSR